MSTFPLPPESTYGYVVGRLVRFTADTAADPDALPEALPATGSITFTAKDTIRKATNYSAFVLTGSIECPLDSQGNLVNPNTNNIGIWLSVGVWRVKYNKAANQTEEGFPAFDIMVTSDHTLENPLDLVTATPYTA